jgi:hypothetical protein
MGPRVRPLRARFAWRPPLRLRLRVARHAKPKTGIGLDCSIDLRAGFGVIKDKKVAQFKWPFLDQLKCYVKFVIM